MAKALCGSVATGFKGHRIQNMILKGPTPSNSAGTTGVTILGRAVTLAGCSLTNYQLVTRCQRCSGIVARRNRPVSGLWMSRRSASWYPHSFAMSKSPILTLRRPCPRVLCSFSLSVYYYYTVGTIMSFPPLQYTPIEVGPFHGRGEGCGTFLKVETRQ